MEIWQINELKSKVVHGVIAIGIAVFLATNVGAFSASFVDRTFGEAARALDAANKAF